MSFRFDFGRYVSRMNAFDDRPGRSIIACVSALYPKDGDKMNPKQMARPGALGSSVFLLALATLLLFAPVMVAGPMVTVYKNPT